MGIHVLSGEHGCGEVLPLGETGETLRTHSLLVEREGGKCGTWRG